MQYEYLISKLKNRSPHILLISSSLAWNPGLHELFGRYASIGYLSANLGDVSIDMPSQCLSRHSGPGGTESLKFISKHLGALDVVIDQAPGDHRLRSRFDHFYAQLSREGVYVVEKPDRAFRDYVKHDLLKQVNIAFQARPLTEFGRTLHGIHFFGSAIIFEKGESSLLRQLNGRYARFSPDYERCPDTKRPESDES